MRASVAIACLMWATSALASAEPTEAPEASEARLEEVKLEVPDVELLDQDGRKVQLRSLLQGKKRVAVNFVFTTCSTVCSPMTAIFSQLQRELGTRGVGDVELVSITLDPAVDTPARLKAYADQFGRRDGWTFLTGRPEIMARVLRGMGGHVPDKTRHAPFTLMRGDGPWFRLLGLTDAKRLAAGLEQIRGGSTTATMDAHEAGKRWFTDNEVIDQYGKPHRFYSDLIRNHTVLIHFGFTSCKGACSPIARNMARVQRLLADRMEKEVRILTVSVDPETDTPAVLHEYAKTVGAGQGWSFLTGVPEALAQIRKRLGDSTATPDEHPMLLLIGNVETGNWVKAMATDAPEKIADAVIRLDEP